MTKSMPLMATTKRANAEIARLYPGESGARQPIHTVYGGAHLFTSDVAPKLGALALAALNEHAPTADAFAKVLGLHEHGDAFARTIRDRVVAKLKREPVEDFRIDFKTVTATGRMQTRTATPRRRPRPAQRGHRRAPCHRSSAFASSRCRPSSTLEA